MPRSTKAARVQVSRDATVADLPTGSALSSYTWALTVPTRGLIKKIMFRLTDGSGINGSSVTDSPCFFVHTTCAAGEGKNKVVSGEETSVIVQYPYTVENSGTTGGIRRWAAGVFVYMTPLSTAMTSGGLSATTAQYDQSDAPTDVYYDLSGTTKGPVAGTGTLFVTMSGQGSGGFDYTAMSSATIILDIEPAS